MLDRLGISPTQIVGTMAFGAAAIACLAARRRNTGRAWIVLALINCLFLVEILIGFRHQIHSLANSILIADGKYGDRAPLQKILILSLLAIACLLATLVLFRPASPPGVRG